MQLILGMQPKIFVFGPVQQDNKCSDDLIHWIPDEMKYLLEKFKKIVWKLNAVCFPHH